MYDKFTDRTELDDELLDTTYLQPLLHCWAHSVSPLDLPSVALIQQLQTFLDREPNPLEAYKSLQVNHPQIIESLNSSNPFDKV